MSPKHCLIYYYSSCLRLVADMRVCSRLVFPRLVLTFHFGFCFTRRILILISVYPSDLYIRQGGGGVSQQGASARDDLDGPQDQGGSDSLGTTARRARRKIVRLSICSRSLFDCSSRTLVAPLIADQDSLIAPQDLMIARQDLWVAPQAPTTTHKPLVLLTQDSLLANHEPLFSITQTLCSPGLFFSPPLQKNASLQIPLCSLT